MTTWDPARTKAQLRQVAQRLGQAQAKKDSESQITRRDIATLLQQSNVSLARAKAQKLSREDSIGDVLEVLEMHIGVILEHFGELDQNVDMPSPPIVEAASSIIYAASQLDNKDLHLARDLLAQRLGSDFARSAVTNRDNYVSTIVLRALTAPPPSIARLDDFLQRIAKFHGVQWVPELLPHERLNALSELLNPSSPAPVVDLPQLRNLSLHGIPDHPAWLRPRTWRLLLGNLPVLRAAWEPESRKQRDSYYDLVRRLLEPFSSLPSPTTPLCQLDASLMSVSKELSRVPPNLFSLLEEEPEPLPECPLDPSAPKGIRIDCADSLDVRFRKIKDNETTDNVPEGTPEIRLEIDNEEATGPSTPTHESRTLAARRPGAPTTLHHPRSYNLTASAHQRHTSALLRLLYIHACLNPGNRSPHLASLLVPLYSVLVQEIEQQELAHAEADTFWVFETMIGEFAELEDEETGHVWMKKFGERLKWADEELSDNLNAKGLDPALPHYSFRWLAPVLTHTLPLPSVFMVWDGIFSRPPRTRDTNEKLDYLLDICTSMLLRAKGPLLRLGKPGARSPSLWGDEYTAIPPPSPLRSWELSDAFLEGMSLLQLYPTEAAGGTDSIIQTAIDLSCRRAQEMQAPQSTNTSFGARMRETMWRGFTNQVADLSPDEGEEERSPSPSSEEEVKKSSKEVHDDEAASQSSAPTLKSRWAGSVWKGFTNQASPVPSRSPTPSPTASPLLSPSLNHPLMPEERPASLAPAAIWSYAEKLRDSDTAAKLAKASTNWKVMAMEAWNRGGASGSTASAPSTPAMQNLHGLHSLNHDRKDSITSTTSELIGNTYPKDHHSRQSVYSLPPRPAFFRPPRDSMMPPPRDGSPLASPIVPDEGSQSDGGLFGRTLHLQQSLANLTGRQTSPKDSVKSGPRPLLLSSSSLMTGSNRASMAAAPPPQQGQWSDVMASKRHMPRQDSQSSISTTLTASDALSRSRRESRRSDWSSAGDRSSRIVPLHRSRSPMAPTFRASARDSASSSVSTSDYGLTSPPAAPRRLPSFETGSARQSVADSASENGWGRIDPPDSPTTLPSPPPPRTPITLAHANGVSVRNTERQRGSMVLSETNESPLDPPAQSRKVVRKKTPPPMSEDSVDTSDSSASPVLQRNIRVRSKRGQSRPSALKIQDASQSTVAVAEQKTPSPSNLMAEWPTMEHESSMTPRAATFDGSNEHRPVSPSKRVRKVSNGSRDGRPRKISTEGHVVRTRKVSNEGRRTTESAAEEGDDEGYDDLLSAYSENEDGPKLFAEIQ